MKNLSHDLNFFQSKSREMRIEVLNAIYHSGKGHIGGAFSIIEILVSLYYGSVLNFDPNNSKWESRDRFILSKGHAAIALYVVLADLGFFSKEELNHFNQGKLLSEHPYPEIPGVEIVSGSLGHGLPIGAGMALADKFDAKKNRKTIVLMGDGECYEGSVWEAAIFASHHQLNNLWTIIDRNKMITHGSTESINRLEPFRDKWEAFGWRVYEVDAHSTDDLTKLWSNIENNLSDKPTAVIAHSVKGRGVSFMENQAKWHHGGLSDDLFESAIRELEEEI